MTCVADLVEDSPGRRAQVLEEKRVSKRKKKSISIGWSSIDLLRASCNVSCNQIEGRNIRRKLSIVSLLCRAYLVNIPVRATASCSLLFLVIL